MMGFADNIAAGHRAVPRLEMGRRMDEHWGRKPQQNRCIQHAAGRDS